MDFFISIYDTLTTFVLPFLLVLTVIVFVHEMGHFLVGKWCGAGITAFSIGFGPELFGHTDKKGVRWKICAVPLGGYVKFVDDENVASLPTGKKSPDTNGKGLQAQPLLKRAAIVAAGPFANFAFSIVVLAGLFMSVGQLIVVPQVETVVEGGPADKAGILPGDIINAVAGYSTPSFTDVRRVVAMNANTEITVKITRDGSPLELVMIPEPREIDTPYGSKETIGIIGIVNKVNSDAVTVKKFGLFDALGEGVRETWFIITNTIEFIGKLFQGKADVDQLGGPIKIAQITGQAAEASSDQGLVPLIQLMAMLSISIGLVNLFPVPMLDGGHLMFYAIEAVRGGKPLPPKVQEFAATIGFGLIISLMVFTLWNDLT